MPRVHLIHGFNVRDGGEGSIGRLRPFFEKAGYEVISHDYGWAFLFLLRQKNDRALQDISEYVEDGDILVGHSNGCLICWELIEVVGVKPSLVICIQPALRRDTIWSGDVIVLCFYNKWDWIVTLGRMWGRFVTRIRPWSNRHGWGSAGRNGFTSGQKTVKLIDTAVARGELFAARGHSAFFKTRLVRFWGAYLIKQVKEHAHTV